MIELDGETLERAAVVREAVSWIGTAFHHKGRVKARRNEAGAIVDRGGVDCAQSVYAIYRASVPDRVPERIDAVEAEYGFHWNLSKHLAEGEPYLTTVLAHAREVERPGFGDLALFRLGHAFAHGAIVMPPGWPTIAHANAEARLFMLDRADLGRLASRPVKFFSLWA